MNQRTSFFRKITYLALIAVLLIPISQLGAPATLEDEGGVLAQLRYENDLGQSNLGDIDPASETIRLATLGLRGIATSILWSNANEFKKKEDWTSFQTTLNQLAKLQPYFISVWRYQAWNLTYNVSVELDDVRDRYYYVRRGIEYLKQGIKYNRNSPYLLAELGWFIGSKIGTADEKREYRRLFKADDDFHPADRPLPDRDNWLVSRSWNEAAVSAVDDQKKSMGNKNPTVFYAAPGMSQINYGSAIEEEGTFGSKARKAWTTAAQLWRDYGNREMRASDGTMIQLANYDRWKEEGEEMERELEALAPEAREGVLEQLRGELTTQERESMDKPVEELTMEEMEHFTSATYKMKVTPQLIADWIVANKPEKAVEARKLANRIAQNNTRVYLTRNNRQVSNFDYWKTRCEVEQSDEALEARESAYAALQAFRDDADLLEARRLYEKSFDLWAQVFEQHPELDLDSPSASDIMDDIEYYTKVLEQMELSLADEEVDENFPLWDMLDANDNELAYKPFLDAHKQRLGIAE